VEKGIIKKRARDAPIRVALVYPGTYAEALSSLGYLTVHARLNEHSDIVAHRFDFEHPLSVEEALPIRAYDIVLASVHYELQLPRLYDYLQRIGYREGRQRLLIGGPGVWNPLPASQIADAVLIGEAEDVIVDAVLQMYAEPEDAWKVEGLFVSSRGREQRVKFVRHDLSYRPPAVVAEKSAMGRYAVYVEPSRGCNFGCRFCLVGWCYRPRRDRKLSQILDWIAEGIENEAEKVYFYGSDLLGHPHMVEILRILNELRVPFSLSSMRIDRLSDDVLEVLSEGCVKTITIAPEVVSTEKAIFINKVVERERVVDVSLRARRKGIPHIRLYFMIGLGEDNKDIKEMARLCSDVKGEASVSVFVPKPYTPFQWAPFEPLNTLKAKEKMVKKLLKTRITAKKAWIQCIIAMGDERIGQIIKKVRSTQYTQWVRALSQEGIDPQAYTKAERETPWMRVVDTGVKEKYLRKEWEKALSGETTPPCHEKCTRCGICVG